MNQNVFDQSHCWFAKSNISLWKPIDSHWFKNALLKLFSFQLCLYFFLKMMKLYKKVCFAWISHTYPERFSHRLTSYALQKYSRNIFDLFKCTSMDFIKQIFQEMINLWHFLCMWLDIPLAKNWFSLFACVLSSKLIYS